MKLVVQIFTEVLTLLKKTLGCDKSVGRFSQNYGTTVARFLLLSLTLKPTTPRFQPRFRTGNYAIINCYINIHRKISL